MPARASLPESTRNALISRRFRNQPVRRRGRSMQGRPRSLLIEAPCQCGMTDDIRFLPVSVTRFPEGRRGRPQARRKRRTTPPGSCAPGAAGARRERLWPREAEDVGGGVKADCSVWRGSPRWVGSGDTKSSPLSHRGGMKTVSSEFSTPSSTPAGIVFQI